MHINTFDRYLPGNSLVHRLDPRTKVVATAVAILSTVLLPDGAWLAFGLTWLGVVSLTWLAQLPYRLVWRRSLVIIPFLLAAVTVLFNLPGTPLFTWQAGPFAFTVTDAGWLRFASIIVRGWLAVQWAILLTTVTVFPDLMHALTRLRLPAVLVGIITFMYRYLFVLADEALRLVRARQARSARLPGAGVHGGSLRWRAKVTGHLVGQLFSRSLDRSDRVYQAMLARGYHGRVLTMRNRDNETMPIVAMPIAPMPIAPMPIAPMPIAPMPIAPNGLPTLHVTDLCFTYPDGLEALKGITFHIALGEKVALVGPNGAGKSTLMLHLNGLLTGQGEVGVAGLPVRKENLPVIRAHVGMVFQNPDDQLFSPTVFDDVAFGPLHLGCAEAEVRQRVALALAQVGMSDFAARLCHHLSLGQKKRVAIATVLAMQPEILVLDEPSAGLDPRARRQLIHLLRELPLTMLVSTHDMLLVQELFPRMIMMDEGQVVADGPTAVLLHDEPLLAAHGLERPCL